MDPPEWDPRACVGVVGCAQGYPESYEKGIPIRGLELLEDDPDTVIFHAGTKNEGALTVTNGGRVLCVTSLGEDLTAARQKAYAAFEKIEWTGKFCRNDIGLPRPARPGLSDIATGEDSHASSAGAPGGVHEFDEHPDLESPLRGGVGGVEERG